MIYIYCTAFIFFCIYGFIIINFYYGWKNIRPFSRKNLQLNFPVSIIIPFRNEEKKIDYVIQDILNQEYPAHLYEIILINDHSTDESVAKIQAIEDKNKTLKILHLSGGEGKKQAIKYGIDYSSHNLVITTDADCRINKHWLSTIVSFYLQNKSKVIIGPVLFEEERNFFSKLQSIEFLSLVASSAGAVGVGKPIMANGANLIFEKQLYYEVYSKLINEIASGDDVFLIHEVKKKYRNEIKYLKSVDAAIYTQAQKTLRGFINQRIRWAGKSVFYHDNYTIVVSLIVFIINSFLFLFTISGFFKFELLFPALILYIFKSIIDFPLLYKFSNFFKKRKILRYFLLAQLIYPFYIVIITILGLLSNTSWKGRRI